MRSRKWSFADFHFRMCSCYHKTFQPPPSDLHCRYIISCKGPVTPKFVSETLRTRFPGLPIQEATDDTQGDKMDNSRVQEGLGLIHRDPASTLVDMAVTAIQLGLAKPTAAA